MPKGDYVGLTGPRYGDVEPHWKLAIAVVRSGILEEGARWLDSKDGHWWFDRMGFEHEVVKRMYQKWAETGGIFPE